MKGNAIIRKLIESDIKHLSQGFINQGWPGREEILASCIHFQGLISIPDTCPIWNVAPSDIQSLGRAIA